MEARRLHVIGGSWFGSLMPFSLHAPRHIGMEEVGWWGDPRRWDYRHASMRRQAWRRLGGGETRVRGLYSRSRNGLDFVISAADSDLRTVGSCLACSRGIIPHSVCRVEPISSACAGFGWIAWMRHWGSVLTADVTNQFSQRILQASLNVCGWSDQP